jgi:hypothetical protein
MSEGTYEFVFQEGSMGLQIDHDCVVEEIDEGEQASMCPDLKVGHLVTHVNGTEIPDPKYLDQLRELISKSGRPMTLRFSTVPASGSKAAVEEEDVASLVQQVSKARREMNSLRQTLEASTSAGSNERTVKKINKLLAKKEKKVSLLEQRLDAAGYEPGDEKAGGNSGGNAGGDEGGAVLEQEEPAATKLQSSSSQIVEEEIASNPLKVNINLDELEEKSQKKKKRGKSSFRKFSTIIGRAFTTKKKEAEEEENESSVTSNKTSDAADEKEEEEKNDKDDDDNTNMKKRVVLMKKQRDLKFELVNTRDDAERAQLQAEMDQVEKRLLVQDGKKKGKKNTKEDKEENVTVPVVSSLDTGVVEDEQLVNGENILERGPIMDPSSSMQWEEEKESLPSILETSELEDTAVDQSSSSISKQQHKENIFKRNSGARSFGDVGNTAIDPTDYRSLKEDVYELYERQFLVNGRQSSMSMVSTDNQRERDQKAIRKTIKYYGKPLLVLFRAYANSAGINRVGNK